MRTPTPPIRTLGWLLFTGLVASTGSPLPLSANGSSQRKRVLDLVTAKPGLPVGAILEHTQIGWGTLYYHLSKLSKDGQIQIVRIGRRRLIYPSMGGKVAELAPGDAILRGRTSRRIAEAIHDHPGCSIQDIVEQVDESVRVVYYHVRRLIEAGLVTSASETRHLNLCASQRLRAMLLEMRGDEPGAED